MPATLLAPPDPKINLPEIEDLTRRDFLGGVLALAVLAACGDDDDDAPPGTNSAEPTTRLVRHQMGETEVPLHPDRIVPLWRPTLAAIVMLGFQPVGSIGSAEAQDFGLSSSLPADFSFSSLELVGPQGEYDVEKIAALQPDLIIGALTASGPEEEQYPNLSSIAPTVLVEWKGTASWRSQLIEVAEALDVRERADNVVRDYEARVEAVADSAGGAPSEITVSLVRVQGPDELRLETPLSFSGQVVEDIGFARPEVQLTPDEDRDFISISLERIRDAAGDLIFVMRSAANDAVWEEIRGNALWQGLDAEREGNVFVFDYEWWGASNYYAAHRILDDIDGVLTAAPTGRHRSIAQ